MLMLKLCPFYFCHVLEGTTLRLAKDYGRTRILVRTRVS